MYPEKERTENLKPVGAQLPALQVLIRRALPRRIYPFLDFTKPWAPVAYIGLFAVHWLFFGVVLALRGLKARHLPEAAHAARDHVDKKLQ